MLLVLQFSRTCLEAELPYTPSSAMFSSKCENHYLQADKSVKLEYQLLPEVSRVLALHYSNNIIRILNKT